MSTEPVRHGFLRRHVGDVLIAQLRQGITPHKVALTCAVGLVLGVFPVMGTTTVLCALAGVLLRLNQPIIQLVNYFAWPLQIPGIYLFVRAGERLTHAEPVPFAIPSLLQAFRASPMDFLARYGTTGLRGILAWSLIAPVAGLLVYAVTLPLLRAVGARTQSFAQR